MADAAALLDRLYAALGTFDLTLAHRPPTGARACSGAGVFHGTDDGLSLPWRGKVFVNPPYGRTLRQWIAKAQTEVTERRAALVVALVPARTETLWWHHHIAGAADAFMLRGDCHSGRHTPAPFPSALFYGARRSSSVMLCGGSFRPRGIVGLGNSLNISVRYAVVLAEPCPIVCCLYVT